MKTEVNRPINSKINWTSLLVAIIGLSVAMDWIPTEVQKPLVEITLIAGPSLIIVFRTFFTNPKLPSWSKSE